MTEQTPTPLPEALSGPQGAADGRVALREQIRAALLRVLAPHRPLVTPEEFRIINELTPAVLAVVQPELDRLQRAINDVRRFNRITAHISCRTQAIEQARDTLQILDAALQPPAPAHDAGPSVRECAEADRAHWADKYAGE